MERQSASWGYCSGTGTTKGLIEQAKEELQILEAQHPNRFNYLKLELKSFISHLESQNLLLSTDVPNSISISKVPCVNSTSVNVASSVMTQGKKRKKVSAKNGPVMEGKNVELPKQKLQKISCISSGDDGCSERGERIDVVVERARACLHKIQQLKASFS